MTAILKVDTIQDTAGNNIINENANTITIGKSGDTVNVAAGSSLTSPGLTLSDNILFDTANKGIYLGTTSATASNLLDDYEEGTWTPTINSGTITVSTARYVKVGNLVTVWIGNLSCSDTTTNTLLKIGGLPFGIDNSYDDVAIGSAMIRKTNNATTVVYGDSTDNLQFYKSESGAFSGLGFDDLNASDNEFYVTATYKSV